jgi:hypothetical protein
LGVGGRRRHEEERDDQGRRESVGSVHGEVRARVRSRACGGSEDPSLERAFPSGNVLGRRAGKPDCRAFRYGCTTTVLLIVVEAHAPG